MSAQTEQTINSEATAAPPPNPRIQSWKNFYKKLAKNKAAMVGLSLIIFFIVVALIGPYFTTHDPYEPNVMNKLAEPSAEHWFGTDHHGRDIFTRIIHGMSITLYVGFFSVVLGAIVGVILGVVSGYYGRLVDTVIMRIMDVLLAFPGILLALAIISILGGSINNVIIAVGIFSIPVFARIVRGSTLAVRKLEYIDAVKALGASDARIIFKHILPNVLSPIIVQGTLSIATSILTASALSFLGLGAQPPIPEWGAMLSDGRNYMYDAPHVALFPGLAIVVVVLAFNIFGDGLRDALDPKSKN
ncbi:ABC transporter permease [Halalkalibacterium halodurans]|jgi:peptide/nickel transport system permease protein|uniref:Oligopeptide ABC transporter (Permease) n=2 Tax=Halalkalibacterium halodurans TaxID=86665 RepID=Q9KGM8_HALH5|nr:nickel transporter permease [Halalkalibacterium halodurans]MDY7220534.1 nickel transporter permease [Halalkalibacterium halodurans]MDY7239773.1 nickel transporter permease [Halalkalibacterium halodurans]MED4081719.1 ABC transporter permease [Halalkalibacterium halodurans]MED4084045.1 ABC transporter permease [Halalkalibacterium halodurans]MED4105704.1 ABC transporter permease [Halalkalibacterium halodurans]